MYTQKLSLVLRQERMSHTLCPSSAQTNTSCPRTSPVLEHMYDLLDYWLEGLSGIYCTKHEDAQRSSAVGNKSQTNRETVIQLFSIPGAWKRV